MHTQGYLLLAIAISNLLFGSFILLRNTRDLTNVFFGTFILAASLWSFGLAGYIFTTDKEAAIWWARSYYAIAAFIPLLFLGFSISFTGYWRKIKPRHIILVTLPTLGMMAPVFTPGLLVEDIVYHDWGKEVLLDSFGYKIYSAYFVLFVLAGFFAFYDSLKKATGIFRVYLKLVFGGLLAAWVLGALFNLFYPAVGNYQYIWVGPLSILVYIAVVSYAIVRHRLFDIRLIVARSIAYLLLLATLGLLFVAAVFGITNIFFGDDNISNNVLVTFASLAIILAFLLQPLRKFFDKVTNRLFYRDAYDAQVLLDTLNRALVTTLEIDELLKKSARILAQTFKSEFCAFAISDKTESPVHFVADGSKKIDAEEMQEIESAIKQLHQETVVTDELSASSQQLKSLLQQKDVAVIRRLQQRTKEHSTSPGYLMFGRKLSGGIYTEGDIRVIDIVADELVIAIQNSLRFEEIQKFNITLQQKIEEATKELRHANTRLKELDEAKDEFISMASHQLRTPLTTVKGYMSMVLDGDAGKIRPQQKDLLQHAFDGADRMVFLIADLLNVSRLQSGKFVIENKPTDLAKLVEAEVEQLKESAANHQLQISYTKSDNFPSQLMLDDTKTRQVVMNFLDNAIYYTPAGGSIHVALEATDKVINYTVTDTGLGVPKAEQHHLFTKFYRAGNARKMRPDGTGLGLFMAKKVVVAQGGAIIFKSTEGKGSTFGFSFPRHAVEAKHSIPP